MKETTEKQLEFDPETYTNPILEECYRIKAEISAQFKTPAEFSAYLQALQESVLRNTLMEFHLPYCLTGDVFCSIMSFFFSKRLRTL